MNHWGERFGINSYSYTQSMSALDCVRNLAGKGVKSLELMFYPGHLWIHDRPETLRNLQQEIERSGMTLVTVNTPNIDVNIAAATEEMRKYSIKLNIEYLRLAGELGAEALILGPGKPNPLFPLPRQIMEGYFFQALDELLPVADRTGVQIWVENMPFAFLPEADALMTSLDRYGADEIGVVYDVANAHFIAEDPVAGCDRVGSRLKLIHISDTNQSVYRHDAIGLGDVDFSTFMPKVRSLSLIHPPILEIISRNPEQDISMSIELLAPMA